LDTVPTAEEAAQGNKHTSGKHLEELPMHLSEVEVSHTAGDHLKHEDTWAQQGHFMHHVNHMLRFKRLD
jgi:hypothetical protein